MNTADQVRLLEETLERCGIEVRVEDCDSDGGLTRLKGRAILFVNRRLTPARRMRHYVDALRKCDLGGVYLPPRIRELLGEEEWCD